MTGNFCFPYTMLCLKIAWRDIICCIPVDGFPVSSQTVCPVLSLVMKTMFSLVNFTPCLSKSAISSSLSSFDTSNFHRMCRFSSIKVQEQARFIWSCCALVCKRWQKLHHIQSGICGDDSIAARQDILMQNKRRKGYVQQKQSYCCSRGKGCHGEV